MTFISTTNDWLSALLKLGLICLIVGVALYFGLSVYGNITEGGAIAALPKVSKAQYEFRITTTGQSVLTDSYDKISEGHYMLNGYYELKGDKWVEVDTALPMDEKYFGPIKIIARSD